MSRFWPFGKMSSVHCPDGSVKSVYRNVDHAFPLYIPGWQGDLKGEASGLQEIKGTLAAGYATKIQGLLFGLDDLNQGLMIHFRSVYLVYASDPCGNAAFLQREVEKLLGEQQRLIRLRMQIRALVELAKGLPQPTESIFQLFQEIAIGIGGPVLADVARQAIEENRAIAVKWVKEK